MTASERVAALTRVVPDFPTAGIRFLDLTPVLADGAAFAEVTSALAEPFRGRFDVVAGIEARGFPLAAAIAAGSGCGVVLIRKAGKLPGPRIAARYELEYGAAELEVHRDQIPEGSRVLLVDDVLATGGTVAAAAQLVERAGWTVAGISVVLEIVALGGRERVGRPVHAVATG